MDFIPQTCRFKEDELGRILANFKEKSIQISESDGHSFRTWRGTWHSYFQGNKKSMISSLLLQVMNFFRRDDSTK